jgi:cell division protein FtsB
VKKKDLLLASFFKLWVFLAVSVLIIGILRGEGTTENYIALGKSRDRLREAVAKLRKETEDLEEEILKIKSSKVYAKKVYKDKYHATESGENIVFFAD